MPSSGRISAEMMGMLMIMTQVRFFSVLYGSCYSVERIVSWNAKYIFQLTTKANNNKKIATRHNKRYLQNDYYLSPS